MPVCVKHVGIDSQGNFSIGSDDYFFGSVENLQDREVRPLTDDWDRRVREYTPVVFRTAWRILGHAADTEDVVQEVFLQAYKMAETEEVRSWEALLRRLAACRALDRLRARRHSGELDEMAVASSTPGPEEVLRERELSARLRQALSQLPAREAEVFCLRYFEDLPYEEIARVVGISSGAVATALHKARVKLESMLMDTHQEK
jgi:RNA polymerase sigma-70 factor (ECF subfamily)